MIIVKIDQPGQIIFVGPAIILNPLMFTTDSFALSWFLSIGKQYKTLDRVPKIAVVDGTMKYYIDFY